MVPSNSILVLLLSYSLLPPTLLTLEESIESLVLSKRVTLIDANWQGYMASS
jgi:hypothetical protein